MYKIPNISDLPNKPAVYALYGGKGRHKFVAYVGIADKLRQRVSQHLIRRDSSITTGASIVSLNPDLVTELRWWEYERFSEREYLEAAEKVAFSVLDPVLRSRGKTTQKASEIFQNKHFYQEILNLINNEPTGNLTLFDFQDVLKITERLEEEIEEMKLKINNLETNIQKN